MAAVPEFGQWGDRPVTGNNNDLFFQADGPKQTKCSFQDLNLSSLGDGAVQLQVSQQLHHSSFRKVVSVVVTMEKLRNMPIVFSQSLQDDDLRSLFFLIFEEEPVSCMWDDIYECDALQSLKCRLQDINQKSLVLSEPHELQAVHLNAQDMNQQVVFCMSFLPGEKHDKTPVCLGIKEKNLYLSCVMKGEKPTLQLETIDPKGLSKKIDTRFVFNKMHNKSTVEFESALYPNWYISTLQEGQRPIFLGNHKGGQDITDFNLEVLPH
ncbi:interleukin-1 beta [Rhinolophus sinicus]|uniref:interleukin-1 beta n=1 Tax=Rhinolophus sinicus TaxID=89399 RepID=UPI00094464EF|nr:PREDICTED: interleukin-1 beta [Rhinolophus sinicus]